jgi:3-oxoacyl-[acyl-carrier protein] reductase
MRGLEGKGVLVSGGTRGIGLAAARRFLEEGSRVFVGGHAHELEAALAGLAHPGLAGGVALDVRDETQVDAFVSAADEALGGVDVLVNNAGTGWEEPFLEIAPESWDRTIAINLRGMFLVAQRVARGMVARGRGGAIVNMSSTNGLVGEEGLAHYNASKGGVALLTKTMALELGRHGIRVNALCPGLIRTPLSESVVDEAGFAAYEREKIPLGRVGRPEEVAAAYAFLASDDASFVHGECLVIDGGQLAV